MARTTRDQVRALMDRGPITNAEVARKLGKSDSSTHKYFAEYRDELMARAGEPPAETAPAVPDGELSTEGLNGPNGIVPAHYKMVVQFPGSDTWYSLEPFNT